MTVSITEAVRAEGLQGHCPIDHTKLQEAPVSEPGKCPIDHTTLAAMKQWEGEDGSVSERGATVPETKSGTAQKLTTAQYIQAQQAISSMYSECPSSESEPSVAPIPSECPMHNSSAGAGAALNPDNMMPPPNQRPAYDQPFPLGISRETSSIPRAGTGKNWVYPSEQMFWNAMTRKGWNWREEEEAVTSGTVTEIIKIHNFNNEKAWHEILLWEAFHNEECGNPKLMKFAGKPKELSPRARFRKWLGYDAPFDRHDWIVDRCGRKVRYILDYYDTGMGEDEGGVNSVEIDVRPALDSPTALVDRTKVFLLRNIPSIATLLFEYPMVPKEDSLSET